MNHKSVSLLAIVPASMLMAGLAFGQTNPQTSAQNPTMQPTMQQHQSTNAQATRKFERIAGSKGYVTKNEAKQDTWLAKHFSRCDSDHNGQVNRSEFQSCNKSNKSNKEQY